MENNLEIEKLPNLDLAHWRFLLTLSDELVPNKSQIKQKLFSAITENSISLFLLV